MRRNKGFTVIELAIVIALVSIVAAIAVPNLMHHRMLANEAAAVTRLKAYATAQETFQRGRHGRMAVNTTAGPAGFCDNYRNLYYGVPFEGKPGTDLLKLITKEHADAYGFGRNEEGGNTVNRPATTVGNPSTPAPNAQNAGTPFKGYYFFAPGGLPGPQSRPNSTTTNPDGSKTDIAHGRREAWFTTLYAQLALPALVGSTGTSAYYIGIDGRVWRNTSLVPGHNVEEARARYQLYIRQGNPAGMYGETASPTVNARAIRDWKQY